MDDTKWLKDALDKLDAKVDKLDQRLDTMRDIHYKNSESLQEHILRTELNEENIALLREEMKPLSKDVQRVHGALKLIGGLALLAGLGESIIKILEFLAH